MTLKSKSNLSKNFDKVTCVICNSRVFRAEIGYFSPLYKTSVCLFCCNNFSKPELKLMMGLFFAYGGYFGKFQFQGKSMEEVCYESFLQLKKLGKKAKLREINIRILHRLLLHGFTQKDFVKYLDEITFKIKTN
ncbi:MAG: hypothetical protein P8Y70_16265 [Candidatus Lokiarchaeota archaeon]